MKFRTSISIIGLVGLTACATSAPQMKAVHEEKIFLSGTKAEVRPRLTAEANSFASKYGYSTWSISNTEKAPWPLIAYDYTIRYSR